jgi:hypothetical protein
MERMLIWESHLRMERKMGWCDTTSSTLGTWRPRTNRQMMMMMMMMMMMITPHFTHTQVKQYDRQHRSFEASSEASWTLSESLIGQPSTDASPSMHLNSMTVNTPPYTYRVKNMCNPVSDIATTTRPPGPNGSNLTSTVYGSNDMTGPKGLCAPSPRASPTGCVQWYPNPSSHASPIGRV